MLGCVGDPLPNTPGHVAVADLGSDARSDSAGERGTLTDRLIYACGDSHTAGGELVDHQLWPDQHPGFWGMDEVELRDPKVMRRWREFRERKLRAGDPVNYAHWQALEHLKSWPSELQRLGYAVKNAAVIGQSMDWVARQTLEDIGKLLRTMKGSAITAIIQPPTHVRLQRYESETGSWHSFQLGNTSGMDAVVHEWFVNNEDEHSLLTRWMISIMGLCTSLRSLDVKVILVNAGMPDMNAVLAQHRILHQLRDDAETLAIADVYQRLCDHLWHPRSMWDLAHTVEKPYCPDLHWRHEVHQALAQDLADSHHC